MKAVAASLCALFVLGAAPEQPQPQERVVLDPHAGVWLHGPNLPSPRQDSAAAVIGGRIYVIGGFGPNLSPTDTTFVLEPAAGTVLNPSPELPPAPTLQVGSWVMARPIPEPLDHAAAAALDGFVYVAGGDVESLVSNKFWRYDPADDSWAALPPLPIPRYGASMQAVGGRLYLIGGSASHGHDEKSVEVYDPATASWGVLENVLSVDREASAAAIFGDRIALVGGRDPLERNVTSCDLWDPLHMNWAACSNMHTGRSSFGLAAVGNRLFAIGGVNILTGVTTQTIEISGEDGNGWMDGHWMPSPRQGMAIAVIGHTVWVIGGSSSDATSPMASVLRYVVPLIKVKFGGRAPE